MEKEQNSYIVIWHMMGKNERVLVHSILETQEILHTRDDIFIINSLIDALQEERRRQGM